VLPLGVERTYMQTRGKRFSNRHSLAPAASVDFIGSSLAAHATSHLSCGKYLAFMRTMPAVQGCLLTYCSKKSRDEIIVIIWAERHFLGQEHTTLSRGGLTNQSPPHGLDNRPIKSYGRAPINIWYKEILTEKQPFFRCADTIVDASLCSARPWSTIVLYLQMPC
jgi:hypothetical protein